MERIVSIGSGRTCGCFTAAFFERNMLYFRRGAVAAQGLGVAMELKEPNQCLPELGGDCRRREKTDNRRGEKAGTVQLGHIGVQLQKLWIEVCDATAELESTRQKRMYVHSSKANTATVSSKSMPRFISLENTRTVSTNFSSQLKRKRKYWRFFRRPRT